MNTCIRTRIICCCLLLALVGCATVLSFAAASPWSTLLLIARLAGSLVETIAGFTAVDESDVADSTLYTEDLQFALTELFESAQRVIDAFEAIRDQAAASEDDDDSDSRQLYTDEERGFLEQLETILPQRNIPKEDTP